MKVPTNKTYQKQNQTLIGSTFKKAVVSQVYPQSWTADIYLVESPQTIIKGVPLSSAINVSSISNGSRCRVDIFDESNPNDMVVAYVYGGNSLQKAVLFASGNQVVGTGGATIPHGLGIKPNIVGIIKRLTPNKTLTVSGGGGGSYIANIDVYEYLDADATNIYLKSVNDSMTVDWYAIRF